MNKISTFYRNFVIDIIIAVLTLVLGLVMLPPFGLGQAMIDILLALTLLTNLVLHLFQKMRLSKGITFTLTLVEFLINAAIIVCLVLEQFGLFRIGGVCQTLGLVLALHGMFSVIILYVTLATTKSGKYNLPDFLINLFLSLVGVFLLANPIFNDLFINWVLCILLFLITLGFAALAILVSPIKKSTNKPTKS